MKKTFLRTVISYILFMAMVLSLLCGCQQKQKPDGQSALNTEGTSQSDKTGKFKLPIAEKEITLKAFAPMDSYITTGKINSHNQHLVFQELQKRTNIKMEWTEPTTSQAKDILNLQIASGDLPDIICYGSSDSDRVKWISNGVIVSINDLMDQYAPNLKKIIGSDEMLRKQVTQEDGKIYFAPFYRQEQVLRGINPRLLVRKDWLDKLGLKEPDTFDDWYNMLKAFKEKDPNGNGKQDEIPYCAGKISNSNNNGHGGVERLVFDAFGTPYGFFIRDGKVKHGFMEADFKKGLEFGARLVKEGLIDPDFMTQDGNQMEKKILNDQVGAWFTTNAVRQMSDYKTMIAAKAPKFEAIVPKFPMTPDGKRYNFEPQLQMATNGIGGFITSKNKYPVESMKLFDYCYTEEGDTLINYGVEGITFSVKDGKKVFSDNVMKNPDGLTPIEALNKYTLAVGSSFLPYMAHADYLKTFWPPEVEASNAKRMEGVDISSILPPVSFTEEDNTRLIKIMNEAQKYMDETSAKILTGNTPVSKYEEAVKQLEKMGINDAVKLYQDALDRYIKK